MDTDNADDIADGLDQAARNISLNGNTNKNRVHVFFLLRRAISTLNRNPLKLVDKFMYLGSSVSSTESDDIIHLVKMWTAINWLLII